MRIALIGYEANVPYRVGSNQYAFEIIRALACLSKHHDFTVYLPTPPLSHLPKENPGWLYRLTGPKKFWNLLGLPWGLYRQKPRPDVVFSPGHYSPPFSPAPLVVAIMDLGFLRSPEQFKKTTFYKLKFWTEFSVRKAAHILAISRFTADDIIKTYQIDPKKVTVTSLGYDRERFHIQKNKSIIVKVKRKYGVWDDYVLFLGTLKPSKNIEGLLEAFKIVKSLKSKVKSNKENLKLVLAGKTGWLYKPIYEKVKKLGLEEEVVFTGFVKENDVPFLMAGARVFCLPSFWEGFGIPVLEAMASGVPVVASEVASLPEVVGKAGILVDPKDSENIAWGISKALEEREKLVALGLSQANKFSWERCGQQTLAVLENIKK